ncbi:hypothetical protein [Glycomyces algeriensis]|uniref:Uncharacterized protein n=1 Tax=Glycomyces algeriensis TaxID=256037 RepID=A0A9W6LGD5_9ACTN|nr:hypothetical protein [Glycomyces algeriensis]MDR7350155.1 cell division protein FtsL [Glycomyces algeriensis]GLI42867.1 hypothetical protein GALLR39Z86_27170 [Glycomyces algeriensis]
MAKPPRKRLFTIDRVRLVFEAILTVTAVVSIFLAISKDKQLEEQGQELTQSQEQEQSLSVEITNLVEQVDERDAEADALQARIDELEADTAPTDGAGSENESGYVTLETNVDSESCDNFGYGDWTAASVQYAGGSYSRGFNCGMAKGSSTDTAGGYIDFLVPTGATTLTGAAGIDENSDASDMRLTFAIYAIPDETDPIWSTELEYGGLEEFTVDVTGVSRVRFEVTMLDAEEGKRFQAGFADVGFTT